jgi:hypothetical protein
MRIKLNAASRILANTRYMSSPKWEKVPKDDGDDGYWVGDEWVSNYGYWLDNNTWVSETQKENEYNKLQEEAD